MTCCAYAALFGAPRTGLHAARLPGLDVAAIDVGATVLAAAVLSPALGVCFARTLAALLAAGIVLHRLFCVRTTVDRLLFGG